MVYYLPFLLFFVMIGLFFYIWIWFWIKFEWWPLLIWLIAVWGTIFWWWYLSFIVMEKFLKYLDNQDKDTIKNLNWITAILVALILIILIFRISNWNNWKCYDKTSIDYNWQNDMKCINGNWEVKWTDYEWARKLMWK